MRNQADVNRVLAWRVKDETTEVKMWGTGATGMAMTVKCPSGVGGYDVGNRAKAKGTLAGRRKANRPKRLDAYVSFLALFMKTHWI